MKKGTVSLQRSSPGWRSKRDGDGLALPVCEKHKPTYAGKTVDPSGQTTTYLCQECGATYYVVEVLK